MSRETRRGRSAYPGAPAEAAGARVPFRDAVLLSGNPTRGRRDRRRGLAAYLGAGGREHRPPRDDASMRSAGLSKAAGPRFMTRAFPARRPLGRTRRAPRPGASGYDTQRERPTKGHDAISPLRLGSVTLAHERGTGNQVRGLSHAETEPTATGRSERTPGEFLALGEPGSPAPGGRYPASTREGLAAGAAPGASARTRRTVSAVRTMRAAELMKTARGAPRSRRKPKASGVIVDPRSRPE